MMMRPGSDTQLLAERPVAQHPRFGDYCDRLLLHASNTNTAGDMPEIELEEQQNHEPIPSVVSVASRNNTHDTSPRHNARSYSPVRSRLILLAVFLFLAVCFIAYYF